MNDLTQQLLQLARTADEKGHPAETVEYCVAASRLDSSLPFRARLAHAKNLMELGRLNAADEMFGAITDAPSDGLWLLHLNKGRVCDELLDNPSAILHFTECINANPGSTMAYVFLACTYIRMQELEKAIKVLHPGVAAEGDRDEVYLTLGDCYKALREYDLARLAYLKALEITPEYSKAKEALRDVDAALDAMRRISTSECTAETLDEWLEMVKTAEREDRPSEAVELLKAIVASKQPMPPWAWVALADELRMIGRYEESEQVFASITDVPHDKARYILNLFKGQLCLDRGNVERAIGCFTEATDANPRETAPYVFLSRAYVKRQRQEKAIEVLRRALAAEGDPAEVYLNIGYCHRTLGQYELAREAFRKALEVSPGYAGAEEALQDVEGALKAVRGERQ